MRFSLTTLLLVAFWIAALMLVWMRREPWYRVDEPYLPGAAVLDTSDGRTLQVGSDAFGNGTIYVFPTELKSDVYQSILQKGAVPRVWLCAIPFKHTNCFGAPNAQFLGQNLISVDTTMFRRRFPEWWWGHFYRPEVWLTLALTGVLIWRGVLGLRRGRKAPN